ncbi:hypothetical protein N6H14_19475 [Paenibacillus sp. CC-CFT747]|nr:hypothetical protein N6H14_19475 [Paenibacillus sp. CC-CFT747]
MRKISFEGDALRMSMDWTVEDLDKVQVLVESTHGASHPSSYHLGELVEEIEKGVFQQGASPPSTPPPIFATGWPRRTEACIIRCPRAT